MTETPETLVQRLADLLAHFDTQTPHTPGPWAFGSFGRLLVVPVIDGVTHKHDPVCDLGPQHFPSDSAAYSNAELISVAPDMLALLREAAATIEAQAAQIDALRARAELWCSLYKRAINEANGLTNYVEDRPELRSAERKLEAIQTEARAAMAAKGPR
jgi:hypothetical protein